MATPTPKTRQDLATEALGELRVLRAGEAATPAQKAQSDTKYDGIYAELEVQEVAFWDREAIPVSVFNPVARLVAQELAPRFGKEYSAGDALHRIQIVASKKWSGKTVRSLYY